LREAVSVASGTDFAKLVKMETTPLQEANIEHKNTGIDVATRFQYTPVQLMKMLQTKGFETKQVYPIHIHGVPPIFKDQNPEVHVGISNLLQNYASEHISLVPYSSSFMLYVQKG
jgi:hypothetical protein